MFDRLAEWITGDDNAKAEIKFLELHFPALTLYRPPTPRPGDSRSASTARLRVADQTVEVKPGDRVDVRAIVDRKGDTVPLFGDAPVTGGSAHRQSGLGGGPFDELALAAFDQGAGSAQLRGTFDVLPALCDEFGGATQTIELLADSPIVVLPTSASPGSSPSCARAAH